MDGFDYSLPLLSLGIKASQFLRYLLSVLLILHPLLSSLVEIAISTPIKARKS